MDRDGGKLVDGMGRPDLFDGADRHLEVPTSVYGSAFAAAVPAMSGRTARGASAACRASAGDPAAWA
ncbi:MAG TPA: hypothetical protein VN714_11445 [Trebonia sp.]|nr:hypothetical protein [Trebonia sp.]